MLPVKKIYIDSRFKSSDSASDSDFKIDLPQSLTMPEDTVFYIDDVSIPVSWYMIDSNRNNKLYVRYDTLIYVITLRSGNYTIQTLNAEIADQMNNAMPSGDAFTADPKAATNQISIKVPPTSSIEFEILTDAQLLQYGYSAPLQTANAVLRNMYPKVNSASSPFVSSYVDMFPIRNIYIVSPNLGNFNTISCSGESGIVKKVPVSSGYNEMIFDQVVLGSDYLDCSRQTLRRLEFKLKDVFGNIINLNDNHVSFSIVFARQQIE